MTAEIPSELYEAVARAQAERSGFRSAKNLERLTAQIVAGADFRAAVDAGFAAGVAAGRAQAAADIRAQANVHFMDERLAMLDAARIAGGEPRG